MNSATAGSVPISAAAVNRGATVLYTAVQPIYDAYSHSPVAFWLVAAALVVVIFSVTMVLLWISVLYVGD